MNRARTAVIVSISVCALSVGVSGAVGAATISNTLHVCANGHTGALRAAKHCAHGEITYTLSTKAVAGPRGATGPVGPQGAPGQTGATGATGQPGAAAAPIDTSQYATRSENDGRYAARSSVRSVIELGGSDFHTIATSAATSYQTGDGLSFDTGESAAIATLPQLPVGATITSVAFYVKKTTTGLDQFYLQSATPATGTNTVTNGSGTDSVVSVGSAPATVTVTPATQTTVAAGSDSLLVWTNSGTGSADVLYGATVHVTLPAAG